MRYVQRALVLVLVASVIGCCHVTVNTTIRHEWADSHTGQRFSADTTIQLIR